MAMALSHEFWESGTRLRRVFPGRTTRKYIHKNGIMIIIIESFSLERLPPPPSMLDRATLTLFSFVFFRVDRFLIERRTLEEKNTRDTTPCASLWKFSLYLRTVSFDKIFISFFFRCGELSATLPKWFNLRAAATLFKNPFFPAGDKIYEDRARASGALLGNSRGENPFKSSAICERSDQCRRRSENFVTTTVEGES